MYSGRRATSERARERKRERREGLLASEQERERERREREGGGGWVGKGGEKGPRKRDIDDRELYRDCPTTN